MTTEKTPLPPDDELASLGAVRRQLALCIREIKSGQVNEKVGGVLVNAYGIMAKILQDKRDNLWTKRAEVMWQERAKRETQEAAH